jgi:CheY-like chemotaxis protein
MLPGQSGWDFLRERRNDPELANIRVVVLSAARKDLLLEAKNLGADAFLSKRFDPAITLPRPRPTRRRADSSIQPVRLLQLGERPEPLSAGQRYGFARG